MKLRVIDAICAHRNKPRNHCKVCRESFAFRKQLGEAFELPPEGIDRCPFGVGEPNPPPAPEPPKARTRDGTRDKSGCGCGRAKQKAAIIPNVAVKIEERPSTFPTTVSPAIPFAPISPRLKFTNNETPVHLANLYRGKTSFLICGGPSFGDLDHSLLDSPGILTCAINNSVATYRPHIWVHGDEVDHFVRSAYFDPTILKFSPSIFRDKRVFDSDRWDWTDCVMRDCPPNQYFYERSCGFKAERWLQSDKVIWGEEGKNGGGRSTMYAAIRLLYELGIRTIYLLGADFEMGKEKQYHFEQKKDAGAQRSNNSSYTILSRRFTELKPHLDAAGLRIVNCNPTSKLKAFPFLSFTEAIQAARDEFGVDVAHERTEGLYTINKPPQTKIAPVVAKKPDPPTRLWGTPLPSDHPKIYSHSNHAGDLLYALPTIKALGGGRLHIVTGRGITEQIAKSLVTLCSKQSYIEGVSISSNVVGTDMGRWKEKFWSVKGTLNIADQTLGSFGLPYTWSQQAWLAVDAPIVTMPVVIHRSPRYHNDQFPWGQVVEKYRGKIVMVGQEHEHKDFCKRYGQVPHLHTQDYLHLARVIAGCELFIGNQSSPYAVAEGLKKATVQERSPKIGNCHFERPDAIYCMDDKLVLPEIRGT